MLIHYRLRLLTAGAPFCPWAISVRRHVSAKQAGSNASSRAAAAQGFDAETATFQKATFRVCRAPPSASNRRHGDARRHDLFVMTLRASVATCPALACSLLVTAGPSVTGWHSFPASAWFFTPKHIFSSLGCRHSRTLDDALCEFSTLCYFSFLT